MQNFKNYLLLEFEYDSTFRPSEAGVSDDGRALAVGFVRIVVFCTATDAILGQFDFRKQWPAGCNVIYGLSTAEPWGTWSDGPETAILFTLDNQPFGRTISCAVAALLPPCRTGQAGRSF